jgi:hypothetical protein
MRRHVVGVQLTTTMRQQSLEIAAGPISGCVVIVKRDAIATPIE